MRHTAPPHSPHPSPTACLADHGMHYGRCTGVNVTDVDVVFRHTRYTTCISPGLGGSGNPSVPTAAGVVEAMEVWLPRCHTAPVSQPDLLA